MAEWIEQYEAAPSMGRRQSLMATKILFDKSDANQMLLRPNNATFNLRPSTWARADTQLFSFYKEDKYLVCTRLCTHAIESFSRVAEE